MTTSTSTSTTSTTGSRTSTDSTTTDSTVRSGLRAGEQVVAVQFGAWGPQEVTVNASSGGGRGGAPYVAVGVGACLTYAYDRAAVTSHVVAWRDAEQVNRSVQLPDFAPATATLATRPAPTPQPRLARLGDGRSHLTTGSTTTSAGGAVVPHLAKSADSVVSRSWVRRPSGVSPGGDAAAARW